MHLLKNAIEAIEGSGKITLSTGETDGGVCVRISDTGRGIPADQLERIFDFDFHATDQRVKMGSAWRLTIESSRITTARSTSRARSARVPK